MTKAQRRGLEVAKDMLRQLALEPRHVYRDVATTAEILAAAEWIARQLAIDERRRQPRGKYIGKPR